MTIARPLVRTLLRDLGVAPLSLSVAALARKYLLGALGTKVAWVTYYPAVVVASVYGGWVTGLCTAGASSLLAAFAWPLFVSQPFIGDFADRLGMFAFMVNCGMIAVVAESARRARARAIRAREQAETAKRLAHEGEPRDG